MLCIVSGIPETYFNLAHTHKHRERKREREREREKERERERERHRNKKNVFFKVWLLWNSGQGVVI